MSSSVSTVTPSTRTGSTPLTNPVLSPTPTTNSSKERISPFSIALFLLFVQSLVVILLSSLSSSFFSGLLSIGMALFTYEFILEDLFVLSSSPLSFQWLTLHGPSLTRRRRPLFDEVNILETYQPRARTMGHLFVPDPPTPTANDDRPQRTKEERDAFTAARDAVGPIWHYENQAIEAASKKAEIDRFLKASAENPELIPTSKRIDFSKMTIGEILEKRRREKAEEESGRGKRGTPPCKGLSPTSPSGTTETYGVIKRENLSD
ncbi:hypothetical protein PRIPAC_76214 [Pristionchus pacificus]|uniref:Uncharacterized protein n=1 Tax=Pristionchus pacificus TaxID=54126 RepID=A0A2A6CZF6_PRIPA|nr:hypothetical protein PRIPAC_76214 [Pristionchus pacificus]|eukprot:PDM83545.1 hypothetical protein PRIPAC_30032 [Pristionchus pacificus]